MQRLTSTIDAIFDDLDTIDPRIIDEVANDGDKNADIPRCLLISRSRLQDLSEETGKLKVMGSTNRVILPFTVFQS